MRIKVTQKNIDKGYRGSCDTCPLALALKEAIPTARLVSVGTESIGFTREGQSRWKIIKLPPQARFFVDDFDAGKPVKPFEFDLR